MYEVNIYINFSKNEIPLIFIDKEEYEEILLSRELNSQKEHPIMKLDFRRFLTKVEQKIFIKKIRSV